MPPGKKCAAVQAIAMLREAEVLLAKGETVSRVCKQIGGNDHTYYLWKEYVGPKVDQAERLNDLG